MAWQMAILPMVSGGVSAHGAIKSNAQNTATKQGLKYKAKAMQELAGPVGESLTEGYQPGGALRGAILGQAAEPINRGFNATTEGLRGGAWRYGGAGSGVARARWLEALRTRDAGLLAAGQAADTQADDTLARMQTLQRGYKESMAPATVYDNPYAWVWPATRSVMQGAQTGQGGAW